MGVRLSMRTRHTHVPVFGLKTLQMLKMEGVSTTRARTQLLSGTHISTHTRELSLETEATEGGGAATRRVL